MLEVKGVVSGYNKIKVLNEVDIRVEPGERVVLLGRNGMGKTTLAKAIVGLLPVWSGSVNLGAENIDKWQPYRRTWEGIGYVPQGRGLFPQLTVEENLGIGLYGSLKRESELPEYVFEYFPVLHDRRNQTAGTLSGGEQQQLSVGRALVGRPSILILDEPSEGIQPNLVASIADRLKLLATETGIGVLLIEQNIDASTRFAERCLFMDNGRIVHSCGVEDLTTEDGLVDRLLGV